MKIFHILLQAGIGGEGFGGAESLGNKHWLANLGRCWGYLYILWAGSSASAGLFLFQDGGSGGKIAPKVDWPQPSQELALRMTCVWWTKTPQAMLLECWMFLSSTAGWIKWKTCGIFRPCQLWVWENEDRADRADQPLKQAVGLLCTVCTVLCWLIKIIGINFWNQVLWTN